MGPIIIIFAIVIVIFVLLYLTGARQAQGQRDAWAQGSEPPSLNWDVLMSHELQQYMPDRKIDAIKVYRAQTGVGLKEAKDAVEYAAAYPERRSSGGSSAKIMPKAKALDGGMDWDVLLLPELQACLPDKKIEAIKLYREHTGVGLKEAKDAVEYFIDHPGEVPAKIRHYDLADDQAGGIRDLLREGKRAEAQKVYQAFTGVDQFTASEAIDALEQDVRREQNGF